MALHNVGKPAPDPLSNEDHMFYLRELKNKKEADQANLLDFFRGLDVTHGMLGMEAQDRFKQDHEEGPRYNEEGTTVTVASEVDFELNKKRIAGELRRGYIIQLVLCIIFTIFMACMVALSVAAGFLSGKFDWVPTMLM